MSTLIGFQEIQRKKYYEEMHFYKNAHFCYAYLKTETMKKFKNLLQCV